MLLVALIAGGSDDVASCHEAPVVLALQVTVFVPVVVAAVRASEAKLPPDRYMSALKSGKLPRSRPSAIDAMYA